MSDPHDILHVSSTPSSLFSKPSPRKGSRTVVMASAFLFLEYPQGKTPGKRTPHLNSLYGRFRVCGGACSSLPNIPEITSGFGCL
ncbi:hypothetical protein Nepgr_020696 [Nepenthes gracilis]|uniref:Uncharacterized protein n=1 Tax=Nepenthes gracilis TaxID=150966 RepID=A0AAD3XWI2_NEPGR|nr:hypothetical protein Nepgr_020696 [Nepenthes gracilis]